MAREVFGTLSTFFPSCSFSPICRLKFVYRRYIDIDMVITTGLSPHPPTQPSVTTAAVIAVLAGRAIALGVIGRRIIQKWFR